MNPLSLFLDYILALKINVVNKMIEHCLNKFLPLPVAFKGQLHSLFHL